MKLSWRGQNSPSNPLSAVFLLWGDSFLIFHPKRRQTAGKSLTLHSQINANMKSKIIHLHLKEPFNGESDYYFGSLIAIYGIIPQDLLGIQYKSLTNAIRGRDRYENKLISIHVSTLHRSPNVKPSNTPAQ